MSDKQNKRGLIWMPVMALAAFVVFGACAGIMCKRGSFIFLIKAPPAVDVAVPLLDRKAADIDYGLPSENAFGIFNPRRDASELLSGTKKMNIRFRHSVRAFKEQGENTKAETLARRDAFAMRRLKILKALEEAKTAESRKNLIGDLKNLSLETE